MAIPKRLFELDGWHTTREWADAWGISPSGAYKSLRYTYEPKGWVESRYNDEGVVEFKTVVDNPYKTEAEVTEATKTEAAETEDFYSEEDQSEGEEYYYIEINGVRIHESDTPIAEHEARQIIEEHIEGELTLEEKDGSWTASVPIGNKG